MNNLKRVAITGAVLLIIAALYYLVWTGYGQTPDFQALKPTTLPAQLKTTDGNFYTLRDKGLLPSFKKHINVYLNHPNSWIAQWKGDGAITNSCSHTVCQTLTSPKGQSYQLTTHSTSKEGYYSYDVRFIKHGTEVWITIPGLQKNLSSETWHKTVDSFVPYDYSDLRVIRGSASGP